MQGRAEKGRSVWVVVAWLVVLLPLSGCASRMAGSSYRPVTCQSMDVFVESDISRYLRANVGIPPFSAPSGAHGISEDLANRYREELLRGGLFARVQLLPEAAGGSDEAAVWWGRQEHCDLVLRGTIVYLLDGTGAESTRLQLHLSLVDVRSERPAWEVQQEVRSTPGFDIDLYWTTVSGDPAQRIPVLSRALADQFADFLLEPLRKRNSLLGKL